MKTDSPCHEEQDRLGSAAERTFAVAQNDKPTAAAEQRESEDGESEDGEKEGAVAPADAERASSAALAEVGDVKVTEVSAEAPEQGEKPPGRG